jgi:Glycerate kinase family
MPSPQNCARGIVDVLVRREWCLMRERFLVAPDSFKGTLTTVEVTLAAAAGVQAAGAEVDRCPVADGGEGTMAVLFEALGGELRSARVQGPLRRPIEAQFALLGDGETAIVEMAQASGLSLVAPEERDAERADTYGTGELIAAAIEAGARRVLVAGGGSATTDGGLRRRATTRCGFRPRCPRLRRPALPRRCSDLRRGPLRLPEPRRQDRRCDRRALRRHWQAAAPDRRAERAFLRASGLDFLAPYGKYPRRNRGSGGRDCAAEPLEGRWLPRFMQSSAISWR